MKILLIEDEVKTAHYLKKGLEENGFEVESAMDGKIGLHLALENSYQLVIMDIILPGMDGREICKTLRKASIDTPILMLTALGSTKEIVVGFDVGADDYLVKPFEFQELLARIKALTKRHSKIKAQDNILKIAGLSLDVERKQVKRDGKQIELTVKEFALLEYFLRHPGKVISRAELAKNIWKVDFDTGTNMVEVYVSYLRNKIDKGYDLKLIHTQFGMGYILKLA
ncbi:MAG: response regulator [Cytophagales bacterium]|jgi:two-component system copper resistance phosphate regulon response regulator CusR|nr:response regulator [Cytophagales bacterium]MCA6387125.1 response regulator [Cytophagales bacterium]MCA6390370.1 response regulator [Cytophagales bacterium]MCA6396224.1 response regulator [Cytophagales bacterium]MCA6399722.1 response regulator [Cytophagales bacterium]